MTPRLRLAVALLLVAAPLWGPALDLTGPDYAYRTADVTASDSLLTVESRDYFDGPTDQFACLSVWATVRHDRGCFLESRLRSGNVSVDYPAIVRFSGDPRVDGAPYVVFGRSGRVYERTVSYDDANESFVLGLRRVDPGSALEAVATDADRAPPAVREALRTGESRRSEPIEGFDGSRIYRHDGGYVLVYEDEVHSGYSEKPGVERGFEALAVLLGALTLYRVGRDGDREP